MSRGLMLAGVVIAGLVAVAFLSVTKAVGPVHRDGQLREAILAEDLPRVSELLRDAEATELAFGLCYATERGFMPAVSELLARGASPDQGCPQAVGPPLHIAVAARHLEVVMALVEAGANVNATDSAGRTALHTALCATGQGTAIAEFLRERGGEMLPSECGGQSDDDTSVSTVGQCTCVYSRLSSPPTSCNDPRCTPGPR